MTDDSRSPLLAFAAGVAIGAAAALLLVPSRGIVTNRGRDLYDRGRRLADDAATLFDEGRRLAQGHADPDLHAHDALPA